MKQDHLLDLYSDYLLASFEATTATGLSQLLEGEVSHDQATRYLSGTRKTAADLWRQIQGVAVLIEVRLPAGFQLIAKTEFYLDPKSGQEKRHSPVTENEYCRELIGQAGKNQLPFRLRAL